MERIANVDGQAVASGQFPGLPPQQIPLWEIGSNVIFEDLAVRPASGQSTLFAQLNGERITGISPLYLDSGGIPVPAVVWGSPTKLFRGITPPTTVDVSRTTTPYTGGIDDHWSIIQFGQAVLATNGVDEVQYLAPAASNFVDISTVSDLPASFRCKILFQHLAFVLALNTDSDPIEVRWCDEDDPLTWTPTADNAARSIPLRDLLAPIVAAEVFADGIWIAGSDQSNFVGFVGAPFYYAGQHLINEAGVASKSALEAAGRVVYGFGPDGIWESDGASLSFISKRTIQKYVYEETYDKTRAAEVVSWKDADGVRIFWSYPTKDGFGKTISFERELRTWAVHDYWRVAGATGGSWLFPITGTVNGGLLGESGDAAILGEAVPLGLDEQYSLQFGYDELGYGQLGYGGETIIG